MSRDVVTSRHLQQHQDIELEQLPKEEFLEALGLVTKETSIRLQSKSNERKRRKTANPRFSHEAIQARQMSKAMHMAVIKRSSERVQEQVSLLKKTDNRSSQLSTHNLNHHQSASNNNNNNINNNNIDSNHDCNTNITAGQRSNCNHNDSVRNRKQSHKSSSKHKRLSHAVRQNITAQAADDDKREPRSNTISTKSDSHNHNQTLLAPSSADSKVKHKHRHHSPTKQKHHDLDSYQSSKSTCINDHDSLLLSQPINGNIVDDDFRDLLILEENELTLQRQALMAKMLSMKKALKSKEEANQRLLKENENIRKLGLHIVSVVNLFSESVLFEDELPQVQKTHQTSGPLDIWIDMKCEESLDGLD